MTLRFLLDTNVVSELTKAVPNTALLSALQQHEAACAISAPTLEELAFGCARLAPGARRSWFRNWIDGLVVRTQYCSFRGFSGMIDPSQLRSDRWHEPRRCWVPGRG